MIKKQHYLSFTYEDHLSHFLINFIIELGKV